MMSRWTVLNMLLAATAALLAVQIARVWMRSIPQTSALADEDVRPRREGKPKGQSIRKDDSQADVAVITSLDVFDPSRQPIGLVTEVAAPVEVPPPTGIELVGIRSIAGDREAFVRDASQGNAQRRVRTGDDVAGYTVQSIDPTSVELGNATGQRVTLALQLARSGGKPGMPATARPPVPAGAAAATASVANASPQEAANAAMQQRIEQRWNQRRAQMQQHRQPPRPPAPRNAPRSAAAMPPHA